MSFRILQDTEHTKASVNTEEKISKTIVLTFIMSFSVNSVSIHDSLKRRVHSWDQLLLLHLFSLQNEEIERKKRQEGRQIY